MRALQCALVLAIIGGMVCPPVTTPKPDDKGKAEDDVVSITKPQKLCQGNCL